jgi:hypothetical protein
MYTEAGRRQGILLTPREVIGLQNAILCVVVISYSNGSHLLFKSFSASELANHLNR